MHSLLASHQGPDSRRGQADQRGRGRRADHRHAAHHPLFRSDQDRQPVRPITRLIGPRCANTGSAAPILTAAFPEKSPEEIEAILTGVWDNLGRVGAEFAHLDHIWEHDPRHPEVSRIEIQPRTHELFAQLRLDGKPALIFASHLGNWELPALAAVCARARCRDPVSPAQHRLRRSRHPGDARR